MDHKKRTAGTTAFAPNWEGDTHGDPRVIQLANSESNIATLEVAGGCVVMNYKTTPARRLFVEMVAELWNVGRLEVSSAGVVRLNGSYVGTIQP